MKTYAIGRRSSISLESDFITPNRFAFTTPRLQSDGVTLNILSRQFNFSSAASCAGFDARKAQRCRVPGGVFNVIVIGIEFQINQALYFFYDTKIALPAHFQEIGLRLQMPFRALTAAITDT